MNDIIRKAINFEEVDRVPIAPVLTTYSGELEKVNKIFKKITSCCQIDGFLLHPNTFITGYLYTPCKVGQKEAIPTMQSPKEYDDLASSVIDFIEKKHKEFNLIPDLFEKIRANVSVMKKFVEEWEKNKGIAVYCGSLAIAPFGFIAYHRGLVESLKDIVRYPEEVKNACLTVAEELTDYIVELVGEIGLNRVWVSMAYSTPEILGGYFTEFSWTPLKVMLKRFISQGIVPIVQFDVNISGIINILKELRGYIIHVDSSTDILKVAKELGGFACVMGNIPFDILKTDEEVKEYCVKILQGFRNTSFILSSEGGSPLIVSDYCPSKLKTFVNTVKQFRYPM